MSGPSLAERVQRLRARIDEIAGSRLVTVVAVTKGFGPAVARSARAAGLDDLGENYAQELLGKADAVDGVRWHFLGAVQRRKVRALAPLVSSWHSIDRAAAGREVARHAPGARVLVQVNVTGSPARNGCSWDEAPRLVADLRAMDLDVLGLMAVADQDDPRPQFRRLAALARCLELPELSMGMSGDLDVALEEGATIVRVGRALFGPRPEAAALRGYCSAEGGG